MRCILLCLIFSLSRAGISLAQGDPGNGLNCHKKTYPGFTGGPEKLAHHLTGHLVDDSNKVCAIYSWITSNIAYDIHKLMTGNNKRMSPEKLIRKRKAICLGYADLFNELCRNAGIESVLILGYVKTIDRDVGDRFYHTTHAWNAAKINGEWKLFDATWDAGYVQWVRQTWRGKLLHIITFGMVDKYYFKPKFYQDPSSRYFMKGGRYFSYDHLAADPEWQLMDGAVLPENWSNDSTFYFEKKPEFVERSFNKNNYTYHDYYEGLSEADQLITMGLAAYKVNPRNHNDVAGAFHLMGNGSLEEMIKENIQDTSMLSDIVRWYDTAIYHYDSAIMLLKAERSELTAQRKRKKKICLDYNKAIIAKCKKEKSYLKRSVSAIKKVVDDINEFEETSHVSYKTTLKKGFKKAP